MNSPTKLIVHCADSPNGKHFTVEDIDQWHGERTPPFMRLDSIRLKSSTPNLKHIGYHFVIYIDGTIHQGRAGDENGAHCTGENSTSLSVCMIGKDRFTREQWDALKMLTVTLGYPVHGHCEYASAIAQGKTCPNFDVQEWVADGYAPKQVHVFGN